jgi:hypothetical protein
MRRLGGKNHLDRQAGMDHADIPRLNACFDNAEIRVWNDVEDQRPVKSRRQA